MAGRNFWIGIAGLGLSLHGACRAEPSEVADTSTGSNGAASSCSGTTIVGTSSTSGTTSAASGTTLGTGSGSGQVLDDSGTSSTGGERSTGSTSDSSSGDESTGGISDEGCADGEREVLEDLVQYPNIAACGGGFGVPGVGANAPTCNRDGGDDGPLPDGMPCSIDDLCAEGWHLCWDRADVTASGLASCGGIAWEGSFFATAQSGEGFDTCGPTGGNDVFGCGEIGLSKIVDCTPLNRSTGNLCGHLGGPWSCPGDVYNEAATLVKTGPTQGGALCCRDMAR